MTRIERLKSILAIFNQVCGSAMDRGENVDPNEELVEYGKNGFMALTNDLLPSKGSFMPNSFVFTLEDDPSDLCYYTPDGVKLYQVIMEHIADEPLTEEDEDDSGFYDFKTYIELYKGYETTVVNVK